MAMLPFTGFSAPAAPASSAGRGLVENEGEITDEMLRGIGTSTPQPPVSEAASDAGGCSRLMPLTDLQILPNTYGELLGMAGLPGCFRTFAGKLGLSVTTPLAHFMSIPEEDLVTTMHQIIDEGGMASPLERGELVHTVRNLFGLAGLVPPSLGAPGLAAPSARVPVQAALAGPALPKPAALEDVPMLTIPLRAYVDQSLKGEAPPLSRSDLDLARARYERAAGVPPEPECKPSAEQLAALNYVVRAGRVPYTDFGVWNCWGPRIARHNDADSTVLIGDKWVTKRIQAPASFAAWRASWDLFECAMVSLGHASRGALSRYVKGIERLTKLFPDRWDVILSTDLIIRSERWESIRENLARFQPSGYDDSAPWSFVIALSAYGSPDAEIANWWANMLVVPCSSTSTSTAARQKIGAIEGITPDQLQQRGPGRRERSRSPPRSGRGSRDDAGGEPCWYWNRRLGRCAGRRVDCPFGLAHGICDVCYRNHRSCDDHPKGKGKDKGKNKDKGKGKNKDKGKGKNKADKEER